MPKFAANLSMLYNEHDFLDRFAAAAKDGFQGVEYLFPYAFEKEVLAEALKANGLTQVLHNMPAGDWDAGERGLACLPDRIGEFQDGVGTAIDYAKALGCTQLHAMAGLRPEGTDPDEIDRILGDGANRAAALAAPILPGQQAAFSDLIRILRERSEEWEESRRAKGIAREYVWEQRSPEGSYAIVYFEALDAAGVLGRLMGPSELEFDTWFREQVSQVHGLDPDDVPAPNERLK